MATWRSQGDGARFIRDLYRDVGTNLRFADDYTGTAPFLTCPGAKYTIFIQKILFDCTTDAAQSIVIRDTAGTPIVAATIPSSPGLGVQLFDFGDDGIPMTKGEDIDVVPSGAGLAGHLTIEAYARILPETGVVPSDV